MSGENGNEKTFDITGEEFQTVEKLIMGLWRGLREQGIEDARDQAILKVSQLYEGRVTGEEFKKWFNHKIAARARAGAKKSVNDLRNGKAETRYSKLSAVQRYVLFCEKNDIIPPPSGLSILLGLDGNSVAHYWSRHLAPLGWKRESIGGGYYRITDRGQTKIEREKAQIRAELKRLAERLERLERE